MAWWGRAAGVRVCVTAATTLRTVTGIEDTENSFGNRIGDQITLKTMQFKMMFELNEAFKDVTLCIMVVCCAKGDFLWLKTPTTHAWAALWG